MSRYINIEPILEWCDNPEVFEPYGVNSVELERKIRQAPSVDIVRCKECRWGKPYSDKQLECDALGLGGLKFPNDFCSYGSRSEKPNNCEPKICDTCRFDDKYDDESICKECSRHYSDCYAPKTEPTISKMEQVETMSCQECKHFHENAVMYLDQCDFCFKVCKYEPKTEPQTEREDE